jgi:hypothetical protein
MVLSMSSVQEIKAAIRALPPEERAELAESLPGLIPELDGDAKWKEIINDPRPRPALTALGDAIEAEFKRDPSSFREIRVEDLK